MALVTHIKIFDFPMCPNGRTTVRRFASHIGTQPARALPLTRLAWQLETQMVFQKIGDDELDAVVNVRLTSEEKERLRDDADMAAISMSALIRARYFGRRVVANTDQVMIKELRRLGGLLKHLHNESDGAYAPETSAALSLLSDAIRRVAK